MVLIYRAMKKRSGNGEGASITVAAAVEGKVAQLSVPPEMERERWAEKDVVPPPPNPRTPRGPAVKAIGLVPSILGMPGLDWQAKLSQHGSG